MSWPRKRFEPRYAEWIAAIPDACYRLLRHNFVGEQFEHLTGISLEELQMRPQAVKNFEILFLISIGVGVLQSALTWEQQVEIAGAAFTLIVETATLIVGFGLLLLVSLKGSNVARWVLTVLIALGLILLIPSMIEIFALDPVTAALTPIQIVLQVAAVIFLFTVDAQPWFEK